MTEKLKFNYIIGNPPYNASGIITPKHGKYYEELGPGGKHGSLAFIMKALDNLKSGGKMIYIIPTNGMVLKNSDGFRKYVSNRGSITKLWVTNKDVFRNKITNKLEACIQGNTFIISIEKTRGLPVEIETEYSNGLSFKANTNYSLYDNYFFPLILSEETESGMNKVIFNEDAISINSLLMKGALHNSLSNDKIVAEKSDINNIKVMEKLNRGNNIKYGWTSYKEGKNRFLWKVVFSPICKVKEIMQYGKVSTGIIEPGTSVQTNYSYIKAHSQEEANYINTYLSHPLIVISLIQLFDNAYINDSNLGKLTIPPFSGIGESNIQEYIWNFYNISSNERTVIQDTYNLLYDTEKSLMKNN